MGIAILTPNHLHVLPAHADELDIGELKKERKSRLISKKIISISNSALTFPSFPGTSIPSLCTMPFPAAPSMETSLPPPVGGTGPVHKVEPNTLAVYRNSNWEKTFFG